MTSPSSASRSQPAPAASAGWSTDETIIGAWNLYTWEALRAGQLPEADDFAQRDTWIWNEGKPADIPVLDGHRVVLLGPPAYERSWRAQRMFASLPASLDARPLDRAAVGEITGVWLARIAKAALHLDP